MLKNCINNLVLKFNFYNCISNIFFYFVPDLVAIPDFDAGAMENWGLMTFRTSNILYDPHDSTTHRKLIVAITIAHELAHQVSESFNCISLQNKIIINTDKFERKM